MPGTLNLIYTKDTEPECFVDLQEKWTLEEGSDGKGVFSCENNDGRSLVFIAPEPLDGIHHIAFVVEELEGTGFIALLDDLPGNIVKQVNLALGPLVVEYTGSVRGGFIPCTGSARLHVVDSWTCKHNVTFSADLENVVIS